jgi:hypothetical protein
MCPNGLLRVSVGLLTVVAVVITCPAQEVGFVDLTKVAARTDLRHPQATANTGEAPRGRIQEDDGRCPTANSNVELRTTVVSLDRTHYQVGDEPIFEVRVENAGASPVRVPISPDLADLQPEDAAKKFAYSELELFLWIAADNVWSANTGGGTSLYGADDRPHTVVELNQGEWVRIVGRGEFVLPTDGPVVGLLHSGHAVDRVYSQVSLYRVSMVLTPAATARVRRKVCLKYTEGQGVPIVLTGPQR